MAADLSRWAVGEAVHKPGLVRLTTYGPELDLTPAEAKALARGLWGAAKNTERTTKRGRAHR